MDRIPFAFMNPVKCIFFLVAMVFLVSCAGSSKKKPRRNQGSGQTTQTTTADGGTTTADGDTGGGNGNTATAIENPLNLIPIDQEAPMSCWAACAQMIMTYVRNQDGAWKNVPAPRQCQQTAHERHVDSSVCCDGQMNLLDGCSATGWPEFTAWNFTCDTSFGTPLPWDDATNPINSITGQINARRPIAFSWRFAGGGSHMMVLIGYNSDADVKTFTYLSPDYGNSTMEYTMQPLSEYNGEDPLYQHESDYYNIQVSGNPPP